MNTNVWILPYINMNTNVWILPFESLRLNEPYNRKSIKEVLFVLSMTVTITFLAAVTSFVSVSDTC
jgi:hypothetical protein